MAGISSKAAGILQNKEKTFQGQRFDDDLGLNWDQFKWRNHDPQIGRFIEIDPLSEEYAYNSTYAFSENKVISHIELEGLEGIPFQYSSPMQPLMEGFGNALIAAGNWFDRTFSFGAKTKVETPVLSGSGAQVNNVTETTVETSTNFGGVLGTLKNSQRPMSGNELPDLTKTTTTTTAAVEDKLEIDAVIVKSTTKGSMNTNGKVVSTEQRFEGTTRRGITIGASSSRSSNGDKKATIDASVGTKDNKLKASTSYTQYGKSKTVEVGIASEQKVGKSKVTTTVYVKAHN